MVWGCDSSSERPSGGDAPTPAPSCTQGHECEVGAQRCNEAGTAVQLCSDHNGDGCYQWGGDVACPSGSLCQDATCVPSSTCADQCVPGERRCDGSDGYLICGDFDDEPCLEIGYVVCEEDKHCVSGYCVPLGVDCVDECEAVQSPQTKHPSDNLYRLFRSGNPISLHTLTCTE